MFRHEMRQVYERIWRRGGFMKFALLIFLSAGSLPLPAQHTSDVQKNPDPTLDRMIAAGRSPEDLGKYVFDTHGCKSCHTIGQGGKLGYTEKGKERAKGFEGCINMLTAMTVIVQVPEEKRSASQRGKAQRFEEFGCTACHRLTPGKLALTELGAKLQHLHLGCVDVEKLTSSLPPSKP
jgi:cytochrome c2